MWCVQHLMVINNMEMVQEKNWRLTMSNIKQNDQEISDEDIDLYKSQLDANLSSYIEHRIKCGQDSQDLLNEIRQLSELILHRQH